MREFKLTDPLYGTDITLFVGGTLKDLSERTKAENLTENCPGYCMRPSPESYSSPFYVWVESPQLPLLCHELLHLTFWVLRDRGVEPCEESEEAYTYWFECMLEQVEKLRILG